MRKFIVISCNANQDYAYFLPLTCWAWERLGWEVIFLYTGNWEKFMFPASRHTWSTYSFNAIKGIKEATIAQVSRLYGAEAYVSLVDPMTPDDLVMLGDIDLIPLGDHWTPDPSKVTVYNHDLTGRTEIPMCFVAAPAKLWGKFMNYAGQPDFDLKRDLQDYPNAKSDDFYKWWGCDQQILTDRLKKYGHEHITFIDRGPSDLHGYARGRVDRAPGGWRFDLPQLIDAHLEQQTHHSTAKIERLYALLAHVWPGEDFTWFKKYTEEFRRITGHKG